MGLCIDHYGGDDTRVFKEVTEVGEALVKLQEVCGSQMKAPAAVLYDRENNWAIQDVQGPEKREYVLYRSSTEAVPCTAGAGSECGCDFHGT